MSTSLFGEPLRSALTRLGAFDRWYEGVVVRMNPRDLDGLRACMATNPDYLYVEDGDLRFVPFPEWDHIVVDLTADPKVLVQTLEYEGRGVAFDWPSLHQ